MAFGTITSTENTFGSVDGTTTGVVPGTLTGSVGVPGPAGPGVPAGGTAGQILQKIDGVDYNTDWVTVNFSATWGNITGTLSSQTDLQTALDGKYSTSNPAGYITSSALSPYLTSATAASTYQTLAGMSSYLTTASAASTYYPLTNPSGYITSSALTGYATESWVTAGFYPLTGNPSGFLTSASLSGYALLSGATFTGTLSAPTPSPGTDSTVVATTEWVKDFDYAPLNSPHFTGNPQAPTPNLADDDTSIATTAFVKGQGYITSAALSGYATESWVTGQLGSYLTTSAAASTYLTQSTAASTYYLQTNPAGYITSAALTGYATESFVTSQGYITSSALSPYLTSATAASTYFTIANAANKADLASPAFTGNPTAPTPATADNDTSIATTAFVKAQGYLTSAPVTSVAGKTGAVTLVVGDVSGAAPLASPALTGTPTAPTASAGNSTTQLATTAFVTTADNLKANIASPTFTGVPAAPTASPGTNTTQIATTAFVTAAVPTSATIAEALAPSPTSTTKYVSPATAVEMLVYPGYFEAYGLGNTNTSGTGATVFSTNGSSRWHSVRGPNAGVAGHAFYIFDYAFSGIGIAAAKRGGSLFAKDWSRKIWVSGRSTIATWAETVSGLAGDANTFARVMLGGRSSSAAGGMQAAEPGIGWKVAGGGSQALVLTVSNGSTLTEVTSSFTPVANQVFDWKIYSDGAGNVTLWVNETSVATSTAGPTTNNESYNFYCEVVDQTASATAPFGLSNYGTKIFWSV